MAAMEGMGDTSYLKVQCSQLSETPPYKMNSEKLKCQDAMFSHIHVCVCVCMCLCVCMYVCVCVCVCVCVLYYSIL